MNIETVFCQTEIQTRDLCIFGDTSLLWGTSYEPKITRDVERKYQNTLGEENPSYLDHWTKIPYLIPFHYPIAKTLTQKFQTLKTKRELGSEKE